LLFDCSVSRGTYVISSPGRLPCLLLLLCVFEYIVTDTAEHSLGFRICSPNMRSFEGTAVFFGRSLLRLGAQNLRVNVAV
jgi:hypothetical protein